MNNSAKDIPPKPEDPPLIGISVECIKMLFYGVYKVNSAALNANSRVVTVDPLSLLLPGSSLSCTRNPSRSIKPCWPNLPPPQASVHTNFQVEQRGPIPGSSSRPAQKRPAGSDAPAVTERVAPGRCTTLASSTSTSLRKSVVIHVHESDEDSDEESDEDIEFPLETLPGTSTNPCRWNPNRPSIHHCYIEGCRHIFTNQPSWYDLAMHLDVVHPPDDQKWLCCWPAEPGEMCGKLLCATSRTDHVFHAHMQAVQTRCVLKNCGWTTTAHPCTYRRHLMTTHRVDAYPKWDYPWSFWCP
ncbi:hypothetical protein BKA93DRAFT_323543 [Sparassis latifolia]